jgi:hypothetical protein
VNCPLDTQRVLCAGWSRQREGGWDAGQNDKISVLLDRKVYMIVHLAPHVAPASASRSMVVRAPEDLGGATLAFL